MAFRERKSVSHLHHTYHYAAAAYATLGNGPRAVNELEAATRTGMPNYPAFSVDPHFDSLRERPADAAARVDLAGAPAGVRRTLQPMTGHPSWRKLALELLSWVRLVESERLHSRRDFKRLSAAGRIRTLLQRSGIPAQLPDHLDDLARLRDNEAFDGPGVITKVRNLLVHSGEKGGAASGLVPGSDLLQCSALALNYVELALLSLCGYSGHYVRRGWRGWMGDDEVRGPWAG